MKKVVLKLDVHDDEKSKQKVMMIVSSVSGVDSISMDMKEKKLTLIGDIDPVIVVSKLRKVYQTKIISVGPMKETEKQKEEPIKDQPTKSEPKDQAQKMNAFVQAYYYYPPPYTPGHYYAKSVEEDPNACVIC